MLLENSSLHAFSLVEICWKYVGNHQHHMSDVFDSTSSPLVLGAPARPSHPIRSQMEAGVTANVAGHGANLVAGTVFVPRTRQELIS